MWSWFRLLGCCNIVVINRLQTIEVSLLNNRLTSFCMFEGPYDVRIKMKAVGICGSDVHYLKVDSFSFTSDFNIQREKKKIRLDLMSFDDHFLQMVISCTYLCSI